MKNVLCVFIIVLVFAGCENTAPPTSSNALSSTGALYFSFDKANAPAAVKTLTTILSRSGFTKLEKTINITTDTSASILFEQVAIGTWKVKVDAKDESGKVLYTGESAVIVLENSVSQVNLVLTPVSSGVGSVQINVTWGTIGATLIDYVNNPVLTKTGLDIDWGGIGDPTILYDDGMYRMYYVNYSFPTPVSYAESQDGIHWVRPDSTPILKISSAGKWDDGGVGPGPVYKIGNIYYMLYQGYDAITKHFQVGLAKSTNGKVWEKTPNPVLSDSLNWEDNLVATDVELFGDTYYMYYCSGGKIGLATSTDGISWKRYSSSPILEGSLSWETNGVTVPTVFKEGNKYKMIYMSNDYGYPDLKFGSATSLDGKNWTKDDRNPIFTHEQTTNHWASGGVFYFHDVTVRNETRIYYTGRTSTGEWQIGFAYKK